MKLSKAIKPISYLKANAAEIIRNLNQGGEPLIITQNGEAKAILMDLDEYERTQEALAMLKILNMSERDIEEGKCMPLADAFAKIRRSRKPK